MSFCSWLFSTVTLKYKTEQTDKVVETLREMHSKIKSAVIVEFDRILPNTTKSINKKLAKGNSAFAKDLFEIPIEQRDPDNVAQFEEMARERLDDVGWS